MSGRVFFAGSDNGVEPGGLRSFALDGASGAIRRLSCVDASAPIYLAPSADGRFLYVAQAASDGGAMRGAVAAYAVGADASLRKISERPCAPTVPCHISISVNPAGRFLFFAEYGNGTAGALRICGDGSLEGPLHTLAHSGETGPDKARQDRPHCHCIMQAPDGFVLVCDLALDKVFAYQFDAISGAMTGGAARDSVAFRSVAGSGPRHIVFGRGEIWRVASGRGFSRRSGAENGMADGGVRAYLLNELDNTLCVLEYCGGGALCPLRTLATLPGGFTGFSKAAAVKISPDGRWVLASNRGHDSIAAFRVMADGALSAPVVSALGGRYPRDFEFAPGGDFVVAGHKLSDEIAVYRFDAERGVLTRTEHGHAMRRPLCFVFQRTPTLSAPAPVLE